MNNVKENNGKIIELIYNKSISDCAVNERRG
jgi:hypothetical protein